LTLVVIDHNSSMVLLAAMASVEWVPKDASMQEILLGIERMLNSLLTLGVRDNKSFLVVMFVMASMKLLPKEAFMQESVWLRCTL
jgi:hypothetical protein